MAAAGTTYQQIRVISYNAYTARALPVKSTPRDNIYEGTPLYMSSSTFDVGTITNKATFIATTPCTYNEAGGTFGTDGDHGQQYITGVNECIVKNLQSTAWTSNGALYYTTSGLWTQTAGSNIKAGIAIDTKTAIIRLGQTAF